MILFSSNAAWAKTFVVVLNFRDNGGSRRESEIPLVCFLEFSPNITKP